MRLTTKSRYGTRMILDLAMHAEHGPVKLGDISKRQNISLKYLKNFNMPGGGAFQVVLWFPRNRLH